MLMKAMIFAAGLGTRLKPLTNNKPKALVKINGISLLKRCILNLKKGGIHEIVVNVHHFADQMFEFFREEHFEGVNITISDEQDELLETGGGLLKAKNYLAENESVLLINVDVLTNLDFQKLEEFHLAKNSLATLVVRKRKSSRFLLADRDNQLCGWTNIKTGEVRISRLSQIDQAEKYAFSGIHIIHPKIFDFIEEDGKFSIIDLYLRLAKDHPVYLFIDDQSTWMDLGKYEQLKEAGILAAKFDQQNDLSGR